MTTIKIEQLTFGFDKQRTTLFSEANLLLDTNWKLGLLGRNGRGKTTLLHLLLKDYPYQGRIEMPVKAVYFPAAITDYEVLEKAETSSYGNWNGK